MHISFKKKKKVLAAILLFSMPFMQSSDAESSHSSSSFYDDEVGSCGSDFEYEADDYIAFDDTAEAKPEELETTDFLEQIKASEEKDCELKAHKKKIADIIANSLPDTFAFYYKKWQTSESNNNNEHPTKCNASPDALAAFVSTFDGNDLVLYLSVKDTDEGKRALQRAFHNYVERSHGEEVLLHQEQRLKDDIECELQLLQDEIVKYKEDEGCKALANTFSSERGSKARTLLEDMEALLGGWRLRTINSSEILEETRKSFVSLKDVVQEEEWSKYVGKLPENYSREQICSYANNVAGILKNSTSLRRKVEEDGSLLPSAVKKRSLLSLPLTENSTSTDSETAASLVNLFFDSLTRLLAKGERDPLLRQQHLPRIASDPTLEPIRQELEEILKNSKDIARTGGLSPICNAYRKAQEQKDTLAETFYKSFFSMKFKDEEVLSIQKANGDVYYVYTGLSHH
jgi:hypothetical protein